MAKPIADRMYSVERKGVAMIPFSFGYYRLQHDIKRVLSFSPILECQLAVVQQRLNNAGLHGSAYDLSWPHRRVSFSRSYRLHIDVQMVDLCCTRAA